ncbi:tetratricopeptide repeat protein [Oscillatoria sp. FACHB-1407]|nr:tetratricopeptide repeat protein [Oscillatoria sp. FACHB-1407]
MGIHLHGWEEEKLTQVLTAFLKSLQPTGTPHNLPRSGAVQFVGRANELHQLHTQLQQNNCLAITAIQGMGGIGKTELALQYAIAHLSDYPGGICWLRALEPDIGTQIVNFARSQLDLTPPDGLELPDQVAYCWRNWHPGNVLIVLDNVIDYEAIVSYLPPQDSRFKVLLTSRLYLGRSLHYLQLDVLPPEAALDLLRAIAGEERINHQLTEAQQLAEWLGYLPLGLELTGRYLASKPDLDLITLQQRLNDKRLAARALVRQESMTATHESVAAAFELSWQDSKMSDAARQLGYLLCLFALAPIHWQWVEQCLPDWDAEDLEDCRDLGLVNRSLLQRVEPGIYKLHQLIREFLQTKLTQFEQADEFKRSLCRVMVAIAQTLPQTPTKAQIQTLTPALPHLQEVATALKVWISDDSLIWPYVGLSRFYEGQGAYAQSLPWHKKCCEVVQERLGEEHPAVATSLNNLAALYASQGRYREAEPLYIQALDLSRQILGEEHPDVASSLNNLAGLYDSQGRYSEAEPLYIQALDLRRQILGEEHPAVATSLNNLAGLYYSQGRYREAEPLYLEALNILFNRLGENHPNTQTVWQNFVTFIRQVIESGQTHILSDHPAVQQVLTQLQSEGDSSSDRPSP